MCVPIVPPSAVPTKACQRIEVLPLSRGIGGIPSSTNHLRMSAEEPSLGGLIMIIEDLACEHFLVDDDAAPAPRALSMRLGDAVVRRARRGHMGPLFDFRRHDCDGWSLSVSTEVEVSVEVVVFMVRRVRERRTTG